MRRSHVDTAPKRLAERGSGETIRRRQGFCAAISASIWDRQTGRRSERLQRTDRGTGRRGSPWPRDEAAEGKRDGSGAPDRRASQPAGRVAKELGQAKKEGSVAVDL